MELFYYKSPIGNFGDDLNTWFWDYFLEGWQEAMPDTTLIGVGTLINEHMPRGVKKLIIGSGVGYGQLPDADMMSECRFISVRGPQSASILGLPPEKGIIDPAIMLPEHPDFRNVKKSGPAIFIPHLSSVNRQDWKSLCKKAGVDYVSPTSNAHEVITRIAAAPKVIAESMHAAIIADTFGTPWQGVSISHKFNKSKWLDWADSVGVDPDIKPLYPVVERIIKLAKPSNTPSVQQKSTATSHEVSANHSFSKKLRYKVEAVLTPAALRKMAEMPGMLSDRNGILAARQRYRTVLDQLKSEFVQN